MKKRTLRAMIARVRLVDPHVAYTPGENHSAGYFGQKVIILLSGLVELPMSQDIPR
jgi:hypothetical protein